LRRTGFSTFLSKLVEFLFPGLFVVAPIALGQQLLPESEFGFILDEGSLVTFIPKCL
jgi:hypothetical protein